MSNLNVFFPQNSNKQGIITDFVTAQLVRGSFEGRRSSMAKIIYDDDFNEETAKEFGISPAESQNLYQNIKTKRKAGREKIISLNPLFNQNFEELYPSPRGGTPKERQNYRDYLRYMNNIGSAELGALFPTIKVLYRYRAPNNKDWIEHAFPFPTFTEEAEFSILKSRFARGDGAGIESVNVDRQFPAFGNLMNVKVNISLFFQNTNVLTNDRTINGKKLPYGFSFLKLIGFLDSFKEQIAIEYGYGISNSTDTGIIPAKMQALIREKEKKKFILRYYGHDFNIQQDGSIRLTVNYTTSQDADVYTRNDVGVMQNDVVISQAPIAPSLKKQLKVYGEIRKKIDDGNKELKAIERNLKAKRRDLSYVKKSSKGEVKREVTRFQSRKDTLLKNRKVLALQANKLRKRLAPMVKSTLIENIINHYEMFTLSFKSIDEPSSSKETGRDGRAYTTFTDLSLVVPGKKTNKRAFKKLKGFETKFDSSQYDSIFLAKLGETQEEQENYLEKLCGQLFNRPKGASKEKKEKKYGYIMFFSLRALISAAFRMLKDDDKDAFPYVLLSNVPARSLGHDYTVNLGDVLIESETFQKWYYENYTAKNRLEYSFGDFLEDIMTDLVPQALYKSSTGIFDKNKLGVIKPISFLTKLRGNKQEKKLFNNLYKNFSDSDLNKFLEVIRQGAKSKDPTPLVAYTIMRNPSSDRASPFLRLKLAETNFNESNDSKYGVSYIKIGANSGLLRQISFSAQDLPKLRTALWAEAQKDSPSTLIRYKYSANVDLVGNNVFFRGGYFAISPNSLGLVDTTYDPGIVGYYVIQKVADTISRGNYQTTVYGTWVYNPATVKNRGEKAIEQDNDAIESPSNLSHNVPLYIEELLSLDPRALEKNGINSDVKPTRAARKESTAQSEYQKDIKENL